jgi:membrane protein YqaA with SNARE-associated domain
MDTNTVVAALTILGLSFASAVIPWINAEVIAISLPAIAHSPAQLAGLVVIVTIGQMAGKCIVYGAGRRGVRIGSAKIAERLGRWQARAAASPWQAIGLVGVSSIVGIPPFYVISAVAGAIGMNLGWFLAAGTAGRLIRFSALAFGALSLLPQP